MANDTPGPIGPFIPDHYVVQPIYTVDKAIASGVGGFTLIIGGWCSWQAWKQTKRARSPRTSAYVWMLWIEIAVSLGISIETWLFSMTFIPPSKRNSTICV
jgi:predicted membrane channel-forming protein YqfA (hemolysin III family)